LTNSLWPPCPATQPLRNTKGTHPKSGRARQGSLLFKKLMDTPLGSTVGGPNDHVVPVQFRVVPEDIGEELWQIIIESGVDGVDLGGEVTASQRPRVDHALQCSW
jgi:hypothetical protein